MLDFMQDALDVIHAGRLLFRYVFRPLTPVDEAPRPYFHPLCTRSGVTVTEFQPPDHRWHHGLSFTIPDLNGVNFWGGPTDVPEQGYVMLANHGRVEHVAWIDNDGEGSFAHRLAWLDHDGAHMMDETRHIAAVMLDETAWQLDFSTRLTNTTDHTLVFKAWQAGYGGLFWRAMPSFERRWLSSGDVPIMGGRAPRLFYSGEHASVVLEDRPNNPGFPNAWFSRGDSEGYTGACFGLFYQSPYLLSAGESVALTYRLHILDHPLLPHDSADITRSEAGS
ncbi:MAG: PmoA family protein [Chloroflexota bacterium]|nr:PmoA family protein [Chloroflexota bacterium]